MSLDGVVALSILAYVVVLVLYYLFIRNASINDKEIGDHFSEYFEEGSSKNGGLHKGA